ncbi:hypothetical protein GCK32_013320 [Trichostrongylus colubriformis]|uniref:Uncharacterized protein n=1 Tax=Trichostrongylus colubriformis TaxID=6319 RepID=A0AAN8GDQ1_TRICO
MLDFDSTSISIVLSCSRSWVDVFATHCLFHLNTSLISESIYVISLFRDDDDISQFLSSQSVNQEALCLYAQATANFATNGLSIFFECPLEMIAEWGSIYRLLAQVSKNNMDKAINKHTIEPRTHYVSVESTLHPEDVVPIVSSDNPRIGM